MTLKEQFARFRAWQQAPIHYPDIGPEEHTCANCGHQFRGNYCPVCRQEAGDGRITWRWVFKTLMVVWGMDSRSLPYSLLQLLLRPGYLIGDYLDGRRQVSFTPLKMLLLVALLYAIIAQLVGFNAGTDAAIDASTPVLDKVFSWLASHPGWGDLALALIMILPTWVLFRFAPRHTRHTLPEGVFIQLFMTSLLLLISIVAHIFHWLGLLVPIYYYITYRQLFGYSRWGTIWRLMLSGIVWAILYVAITIPLMMLGNEHFAISLIGCFLCLLTVTAILLIGYFIGKKTARRRQETTL